MKQYPLDWESKKPIRYHPDGVTDFSGDVLEIGPGRGDWLLYMAENEPGCRFVGIEIAKRRFRKMVPRIEKKGLKNILLIGGNARVALPRHFLPGAFKRAYVLFPDPWPKKRHTPHRLLSIEFMTLLATYLEEGGDLFVGTDVQGYAEWVHANVREMEVLAPVGEPSVNTPLIEGYIPTFFEQKWREDGRQIYYAHYRRTPAPIPDVTPPEAESKKLY